MAWAETFGLVALPANGAKRQAAYAAIASGYHEAISDLPGDLALKAVAHIKRTHRFRNLPLPADIRAAVANDLALRMLTLKRLESALRFGRFDLPPLRPEDRIRPGQMAALGRGMLTSAIARMPGAETAEDGEPPAVSERHRLALDAERAA